MDACRNEGECSQCGFCCWLPPANKIPQKPPIAPKQKIRTTPKSPMASCRYLIREGIRFACGIHDAMDHPSLTECREFHGNNHRPTDGLNAFDSMIKDFWQLVLATPNSKKLSEAESWIQRGVVREEHKLRGGVMQHIIFFNYLFDCEQLPTGILELLNIRSLLADLQGTDPHNFRSMTGLNDTDLNEARRHFFAEYMND